MSMFTTWGSRYEPQLLSILRIITGFLFMAHGSMKLLAFPAPFPMGEVELISLMGLAGILELVGGFLILIGLFTRPVAFILSGEMAFAYFMVHAPNNFWPILNGGESAVLFCFTFLYLAAAGGGPWSADHAWCGPKKTSM
jgi:putative oxidoreductase